MHLDDLFQRLDPASVHGHVLAPNQRARQEFSLSAPAARDHRDFNVLIIRYVKHHQRFANGTTPNDEGAFGLAKEILDTTFPAVAGLQGYDAALARGLHDGMTAVIDHLAQALTARALDAYVDNLYLSTVDPTSKREFQALAAALHERYRQEDVAENPALSRFYQHLPPVLREF
jgi:hypothetical protein